MEPTTVLKTSTEAVSLVAALAKLIKENREKSKDAPLSQLLGRLQIEATRLSADLEEKLRRLLGGLRELGLDPDKSLESQLAELSWYNWIRRSRLKEYREQFYAIYLQLAAFVDDATALMLCDGGGQLKTQAFAESYRKKQMLDEIISDSNKTIGGALKELLSVAAQVSYEIQSA
jgi:hypothetical protein